VEETGAALLRRIGNVAVLYAVNPELEDPIRLPG
jgi:hypothetical protein